MGIPVCLSNRTEKIFSTKMASFSLEVLHACAYTNQFPSSCQIIAQYQYQYPQFNQPRRQFKSSLPVTHREEVLHLTYQSIMLARCDCIDIQTIFS